VVDRVIGWYHRGLVWLLAATVGILILPVTLQTFSRYTELLPSYIWTEEASRFLFVWMIMLGAMVGMREKTHFEVDVWPELAPRPNAVLRIVSNVFTLAFALVFVWWGVEFVRFGWNQSSEIAELPMWTIFIAWPLTGITWVLFLGEQFVQDARIALRGAP
jgi:TRAP-type C4-dicarboxylate transport system permease small subunit